MTEVAGNNETNTNETSTGDAAPAVVTAVVQVKETVLYEREDNGLHVKSVQQVSQAPLAGKVDEFVEKREYFIIGTFDGVEVAKEEGKGYRQTIFDGRTMFKKLFNAHVQPVLDAAKKEAAETAETAKATKEAEKAAEKAKKDADKAEADAKKATEKAEKEAKEAADKAAKEAAAAPAVTPATAADEQAATLQEGTSDVVADAAVETAADAAVETDAAAAVAE